MPIKRAAAKSIRADKKKKLKNQMVKSEIKTLARHISELVSAKKENEARGILKSAASKLYKAVSKGVLRKNTASRTLARLSGKIDRAFKAK